MRAMLVMFLAGAVAPVAAVEIDGRLEPGEWAEAQRIDDFRLTQPLSRAPAPYQTEAWILSTAEGLAIAFRNAQPAGVTRTRQRAQRDNMGPVDRVNLMVDFDADGRTGYNFTVSLGGGISDEVITNENNFNSDWDGNWRHAVAEDEQGWTAELLIPWHIAPMRDGVDGKRTVAINLDRVIGSTGERVAWPAVSFTEPRYLSSFTKVVLPAYSQSLLAITPYVSGVYDNVGGRGDADAGVDIFWKPSGRLQMTAALNPDFGQVESDDLVVNFGAVESFFSDKRPFFTENQGLFEVPFGAGNSRLLYTRRIGGPGDDGSGAGDVAAAVKLNGSLGQVNYGVLAASESGDAGRDFYALRATRESDVHDFGGMLTHVDRPFLDRQATVLSFDHRYTPDARWDVRTQWVGSGIEQSGRSIRDNGFQFRIDHDLGQSGGWRQQAMRNGRQLLQFQERGARPPGLSRRPCRRRAGRRCARAGARATSLRPRAALQRRRAETAPPRPAGAAHGTPACPAPGRLLRRCRVAAPAGRVRPSDAARRSSPGRRARAAARLTATARRRIPSPPAARRQSARWPPECPVRWAGRTGPNPWADRRAPG